MAATRLRKTFHYPDSSDDEDTVEAGMDAQDQHHLLTTLSARDTSKTHIYTLLLLVLPVSIALLTLPGLLRLSTILSSFLAISSLAASAYTLYYLPLPPRSAGIVEANKGRKRGGMGSVYTAGGAADRKDVPWLSEEVQELLARYIVSVNGAVCAVLVLLELSKGNQWREGMMVGGGYVPGLVLSTMLWARRELRVVDLSELEKLRTSS